jgi:hypothetical protein
MTGLMARLKSRVPHAPRRQPLPLSPARVVGHGDLLDCRAVPNLATMVGAIVVRGGILDACLRGGTARDCELKVAI